MAYEFARYLNIRSAGAPTFTTDNQRVVFLSDITGNFQVWRVGLQATSAAQWPQQLTFFNDKVWEIHSTPNAPHLIAVSDIGGNERQQFYLITGSDDFITSGDSPQDHSQQDTAHATGHDIVKLTTDDQAIHRFGVWSKDGQRLYYTSNARNHVDFDLYTMTLPDGNAETLHESDGRRTIVALSPDGRYLLSTAELSSTDIQLYRFDLEQGTEQLVTPATTPARYGAIRWTASGIYALTDSLHDQGALCRLDLAAGQITPLLTAADLLDSQEQGELDLFTVARDGRRAALVVNVNGWSRLYLLDLTDGSRQRVAQVPTGVIGKLGFSADGRQLVFDLQDANRPQDVWLLDLADPANPSCRQLTFSNRAGVNATTFVTPTLIHFPTFDDRQIPALFYQPQKPPPAGGYPCILYVHGGPAGQLRPEFDVRFQYFLGQGLAILATNVRGSSGYGRDYMMLDEVEKRMDSVTDLKYAVRWLHAQENINGERIAIYGRSYGGYMVLAAMTEFPELFAAGIDVVGIANWVTFLERTSPWRRPHREAEYGSLAHHRDFLEQISPIHKIERIQVPLMVLAGDNDPRVPLYESEQVVEQVHAAGGTVEFIHYADEGHKFSKLANRIDSFTKMGEFLQKYL
ncbi:MAG: S9 family peptidase [Caldilineaceae bacterium]|nr:S9 family peptidase [Caldilineaceae bacterium]